MNTILVSITALIAALTPILVAYFNSRTRAVLDQHVADLTSQIQAVHAAGTSERAALARKVDTMHNRLMVNQPVALSSPLLRSVDAPPVPSPVQAPTSAPIISIVPQHPTEPTPGR